MPAAVSPRQSLTGEALPPVRCSTEWRRIRQRMVRVTGSRHAVPVTSAPSRNVVESQLACTGRRRRSKGTSSTTTTLASASAVLNGSTIEARSQPALQQPAPIVSFGGGGIYFFWMLGLAKYITVRYDVRQSTLIGASAGGLIAVLAACEVDLDYAVERAYQLSLQHNLWERPLGVLGIWGAIIRKWLDDLLPADAHERCARGRVKLVATELPLLRQVYLQDFSSKQDLLDACMASAHVPMVLDGRPFTLRNGRLYLDGSLQDFIVWDNSPLLKCDGRAFVLDYTQDEQLATERFDFLKLRLYEEILHMIELGFQFGRRLEERGTLDQYLGSIRRQPQAAAQ